MHDFWNNLHQLLDPEKLLREGGFYLVVFVIYAETGLFFGFFLPGDYLLFLAGMFVATGKLDVNIAVLLAGLCIAAISGNFTGYWFGRRTGPLLYTRKDSFFFKKRYLKAAEDYYNKQGAFALIMGRFVPIVRTFAPIFAGVVKLEFKKFALYNIIGGVLWICSLTLLGYFLGRRFEREINDYLLYIIIGFILITTIPLLITFVKRKVVSGSEEDKTDLN
ncbi:MULTISPECIES: DedA family protein [Pedobacter]|uniref:Membrane protein n=1 Tax=Pedobacter zeae TaxID=1737356 RepID=A0A7W6KC77_9SPHI|nr:DedA family protein [Pedobacter zeae]MBB4109017.1 membrane-associated protein [Pedobacter zeae]GGH09735.1 membrane protein [Pedobacter zeae]